MHLHARAGRERQPDRGRDGKHGGEGEQPALEEARSAEKPDAERPDDESWGDLTAEPREVDYIETDAGGLPAMWALPKSSTSSNASASVPATSCSSCSRKR